MLLQIKQQIRISFQSKFLCDLIAYQIGQQGSRNVIGLKIKYGFGNGMTRIPVAQTQSQFLSTYAHFINLVSVGYRRASIINTAGLCVKTWGFGCFPDRC